MSDFKPDDQRKLDAMLDIFSRRIGTCLTVECLLERWTALVNQLQGGYWSSIEEYEQELRFRGILEELIECLSEHGRQTLLRALSDPDRRFLALTVLGNGRPSAIWWRRYPRELAGLWAKKRAPGAHLGMRAHH